MTRGFLAAFLGLLALFYLPLACAKDVPGPTGVDSRACDPPDCVLVRDTAQDTCRPPACYSDPIPPRIP